MVILSLYPSLSYLLYSLDVEPFYAGLDNTKTKQKKKKVNHFGYERAERETIALRIPLYLQTYTSICGSRFLFLILKCSVALIHVYGKQKQQQPA